MKTSVKKSEIHGLGVFAVKRIPENTSLGFYTGELCAEEHIRSDYAMHLTDPPPWIKENPRLMRQWKRGFRVVDAYLKPTMILRYMNGTKDGHPPQTVRITQQGEYVTMCDIPKRAELMTFFGEAFWKVCSEPCMHQFCKH